MVPKMVRAAVRKAGNRLLAEYNRRESRHQTFIRHNERPVEYAFVFRAIAQCVPKTVLDVGTGTTALPALVSACGCCVTAIDNVRDYWTAGMTNRHWHVEDHDIQRGPVSGGPYDLVTCISVLEHIRDHQAAVANMLASLRTGGHLVLTTVYTEHAYVPNVYEAPDAQPHFKGLAYICQSFSRAELDRWLTCGAEVVEQEWWRHYEGRHWTVGEQVLPLEASGPDRPHQYTCLLLKKIA